MSATIFKFDAVGEHVFHLNIVPLENPAFRSNSTIVIFLFLQSSLILLKIKKNHSFPRIRVEYFTKIY